MTDAELNRAPKTDAEIERLVAEARGWTNIHTDHDDILVGTQPGAIHEFWVPLICSDPAAWGAFYDELRAQGWRIEMISGPTLTWVKLFRWEPGTDKEEGNAVNAGTGRALAEAFLEAVAL